MATKDQIFVPENANPEGRSETLSPSGKYRLVMTPYATKPGCWGYTQGLVFVVGSDKPIAEIRRNYSAFPHSWIEGHPNGHDYLVAGADYQGQTVIELDTGKRRDYLPEAAKKGHGFCWAQHRFDAASKILVVCGCIWACPYEFRFYDFSDPMSGWPEIEYADDCIYDDDKRWPEIGADGTIRCFQSEPLSDDDDVEEDDEKWEEARANAPIASTLTFRREGPKLVLLGEEVSEKEQDRRRRRAEYDRKYEEWKTTFRATDPLYLQHLELLKDPTFAPDSGSSVGTTYEGWCPDFKGSERRWCRRIHSRGKAKEGYTFDLEWAVETGPIKLDVFKDGDTSHVKFFGHSIAGMQEAFAYAKSLLVGGVG